MNCSKRIFVLHEKHGTRYIIACDRELTARAIVKARLEDGYWYDAELSDRIRTKLETLPVDKEPFAKWLLGPGSATEYHKVEEVYLEEI